MYRTLLILIVICLATIVNGQGKVVWKKLDGTDLPDVVEVHRKKFHSDLVFEALIENISSENKNIILKRTYSQYINNSNNKGVNDLLCYGESCQSGSAADDELVTTATELLAGFQVSTIDPIELIHFAPNENTGTAIIDYFIYTETETEGVHQLEDQVTVKYIVEKYSRPDVKFSIDMSNAIGFTVAKYDVFIHNHQTGDVVKLINKRDTKIYYKSITLDGNEEYTYSYLVREKEGDKKVEEDKVRELQLSDENTELNDSWDIATNTDEKDLADEVLVYPNPFNNSLNIKSLVEIERAEIISLSGSTVLQSTKFSSNQCFNTSNLSAGIYIIRLVDINGRKHCVKLTKQ